MKEEEREHPGVRDETKVCNDGDVKEMNLRRTKERLRVYCITAAEGCNIWKIQR